MDPFQAALDAMFNGPGSSAAVYSGQPDDVRVIVARPDMTVAFHDARVVQGSYHLSVRRSEVSAPAEGDTFVIAGGEYPQLSGVMTDTLRLVGDPMIDAEGLTWNCGAEPI